MTPVLGLVDCISNHLACAEEVMAVEEAHYHYLVSRDQLQLNQA